MNGSTPKKATQSRPKILDLMFESFKNAQLFTSNTSVAPSSSTTGACLDEAVERLRRYEQKLNDQVRPNDETLKKLNTFSPMFLPNKTAHAHLKSNFQAFPNGNLLANQSFEDSTLDPALAHRNKVRSASNKQLPAINRLTSAKTSKPTSAKSVCSKSISFFISSADEFIKSKSNRFRYVK